MKFSARQKKLWELVKKYYQDNHFDASHRIDHVERVLKWCEIIIKHEPAADSKTLIPSCMCHDMALPFVSEKKHARKAIDYAREILKEASYSEKEVLKIGEVIEQHSFDDKFSKRRILEGNILFDADKLDSTGPIGIWRILFEVEIKSFPTVREGIKKYLELLENLPKYSPGKFGGFFTKQGEKIAKKRLPYTIKTLRAIFEDTLFY